MTTSGAGRHAAALLAVASIAVMLAAADTYVVVLALTDMMAGVGLPVDQLQRAAPIISGFLLGYIAVLPLIGRLADLVSRQRVLMACLVIFILGSAITALAVDLPVLVTGRVVQGVGGGGLVPATLALVADRWPADRRGLPLGVVGGVQELGSVLGPLLGAAILAVADWRAIFWFNAVAGVVLLLATWALSRPSPSDGFGPPQGPPRRPETITRRRGRGAVARVLGVLATALLLLALAAPTALTTDVTWGVPFVPFVGDARLLTPIGLTAALLAVAAIALSARDWWPILTRADLPGAALLGGSLGCVVLTFAAADPEREVVGPAGYVLLPVGALLALGYLWRHRTATSPLVPRGTMRGRTGPALLVSLATGAALVAVVVDVPLLARLTTRADQTAAALVLVRFLLAVPIGAVIGGWWTRRTGDGIVAGAGLLLAAAGLWEMSRWGLGSLDDPARSTITLAAVGFGLGLALAPVNNAALADAPDDAHGTASSLVVVARMVGMVVGLALLTAVGLHEYYRAVDALPLDAPASEQVAAAVVQVHTVFTGAAIAALVGAVVAVGLLGRRRVT